MLRQHYGSRGRECPNKACIYLDGLTPHAALVDIRAHSDIWQPYDDDLFIPDDEELDIERIYRPRP